MKLVVGLGNPGKEYDNTRHNIGFMVLDYIANEMGVVIDRKKFNGLYNEIMINGEKVILVKPLSYMNLSGEVVIQYVNYFKINLDDILIIHDDMDMVFGKIKFVFNSSSGGHNGIKNIEGHLNSRNYLRLKVGISHDRDMDTRNFVLGHFSSEERVVLDSVFVKLKDVIIDFCGLDKNRLMNKYNNK